MLYDSVAWSKCLLSVPRQSLNEIYFPEYGWYSILCIFPHLSVLDVRKPVWSTLEVYICLCLVCPLLAWLVLDDQLICISLCTAVPLGGVLRSVLSCQGDWVHRQAMNVISSLQHTQQAERHINTYWTKLHPGVCHHLTSHDYIYVILLGLQNVIFPSD